MVQAAKPASPDAGPLRMMDAPGAMILIRPDQGAPYAGRQGEHQVFRSSYVGGTKFVPFHTQDVKSAKADRAMAAGE
jgi:hypothetical protein